MSSTNMPTYLKIIGALVVVAAIAGAYLYPQASTIVGSSTGSTFSTAKVASIVMAPISNTSTSTSILNADASNRLVLDAGVVCPSGLTNMFAGNALGVATFNWYAATSAVAAPTVSIAGATFAAMNITVATSSPAGATATSTYTNTYARIWNAGSYMVFQTNATSSGAICVPYVHYLAS